MRAFFSRHTNSHGDTSLIQPKSEAAPDGRRARTISTRSIFDKNRKQQDFTNHYAQPQDILYPSNVSSVSNFQQSVKSPGQVSFTNLTFGKSKGERTLAPVALPSDGVGGAPLSQQTIPAGVGRRTSKAMYNTLRSNTSGLLGRGSKSSKEMSEAVRSPSIRPSQIEKKGEAPFYFVGQRSNSTPSPRRSKIKAEDLPPMPPPKVTGHAHGLDLEPLSAQTQDITLSAPLGGKRPSTAANSAVDEDENVTPKQESIPKFPSASRSKGQFLEVAGHRTASKSAPSSPLFTMEDSTEFTGRPSASEDTFSLKKSLRRIKMSTINDIGERGSDGASAYVESYDQFPPPSQLLGARPPPMASRSQDLASELNELAVAYEEGLLGEDEYRMLRQNVFDRMMGKGAMEVPKEGRVQGRAVYSNGAQAEDNDNATLPPAPSVRSKRSSKSNLTSLFRRGSKNESQYQSSGLTRPASSSKSGLMPGGESIRSGASHSIRSRKSASTLLETQISQARQARTMRSGAGTHGVDGSSSSEYPKVGGAKGSSIYSASGISMGGVSLSSGNALFGGNYGEKSSDEINAEVAVVEAEGKRILESFKSLQMNAVGRYNLSFDMMKRAMAGIGVDSEADPDFFDDFVMIDGQDGGSANGQSHSNAGGKLLGGLVRKTKSFGQLDSLTNGQGKKGKSKGDGSLPPSSYKMVAGHSQYGAISSDSSPLGLSFPPSIGGSDEEEEVEVLKLRAELIEILRRRNEVAKKYSDRLAFLRSSLRSAKIREGLH